MMDSFLVRPADDAEKHKIVNTAAKSGSSISGRNSGEKTGFSILIGLSVAASGECTLTLVKGFIICCLYLRAIFSVRVSLYTSILSTAGIVVVLFVVVKQQQSGNADKQPARCYTVAEEEGLLAHFGTNSVNMSPADRGNER